MFGIEEDAKQIRDDAIAEYNTRFDDDWDEYDALRPFLVKRVLTVDGAKRFAEWLRTVDEQLPQIPLDRNY